MCSAVNVTGVVMWMRRNVDESRYHGEPRLPDPRWIPPDPGKRHRAPLYLKSFLTVLLIFFRLETCLTLHHSPTINI
jgi:hypothetical protein